MKYIYMYIHDIHTYIRKICIYAYKKSKIMLRPA